MSTRFKKAVLKPENANNMYTTEWSKDGFDYSVNYCMNGRMGEPVSYSIISLLDNDDSQAPLRNVRFDGLYQTEQEFLAGYKDTVKKLKRIGKILNT